MPSFCTLDNNGKCERQLTKVYGCRDYPWSPPAWAIMHMGIRSCSDLYPPLACVHGLSDPAPLQRGEGARPAGACCICGGGGFT